MNTMTETKSTRRGPSVSETYAAIEAAPLPAPTGEAIRRIGTVEQNAKLRALFLTMGIKGIRVAKSHAGWSAKVSVVIPTLGHAEPVTNWGTHRRHECAECLRETAAVRKVEAIILAAFPDCADKSDLQSDYFDYVFGVSAEAQ